MSDVRPDDAPDLASLLESDPMSWPEPSLHAQIAWRMSKPARAAAFVPPPPVPPAPAPDNTLTHIAWALVALLVAFAFAPGLMPIIILGQVVLLVLA